MVSRKAQFFIITVVLVAGSLSLTVDVLEDYTQIDYQEVTGSRAIPQFASLERTLEDAWYSEAWSYRRQIVLRDRSGRNIEGFPVSVTLDSDQLISAGKLQPDCDDLRATQDGEEIPIQFRQSECGSEDLTVWMLGSVDANSDASNIYLYYGNSRVSDASYSSDLSYDPEVNVIQNSVLRLKVEDDGFTGVTELSLHSAGDIVGDGSFLAKAPGGSFTVNEEGPVYINFSIGEKQYRVFAANPFIRTQGGELGSSFHRYYGNDSSILTHWMAGNPGDVREIQSGDSWSGSLDGRPFIAATDGGGGDALALFPSDGSDIEDFRAESNSTGQYMGVGGSSSPSVDYIDLWVGQRGVPSFVTDIHTNPPLSSLASRELRGSFYPSSGWEQKKVIELKERNGSVLDDHPVNVTLNLGEMDVNEDCSDLVFVEDGRFRNYSIRDQCDSESFREPDDFVARFPMDAGRGRWVNDTSNAYTGRIDADDGDVDANDFDWVSSPHRLGVFTRVADSSNHYLNWSRTGIQLSGTSFGISFWFQFNPDIPVQDQKAFSDRADDPNPDQDSFLFLFDYSNDAPAIRVWNDSGDQYLLQGRFKNNTDYFNVTGTTDARTLGAQWHHTALTFNQDTGNLSLFLDGSLEGWTSVEGSLDIMPTQYVLARDLEGSVDEFKVYQDFLTADEVRDQYIEETTLSVLTDLGVLRRESDLAMYAGSNFFVEGAARSLDLSEVSTAIDDPPQVSISQMQEYSELVDQFEAMIRLGRLSPEISMRVLQRCTDLHFDTAQLTLDKVIC